MEHMKTSLISVPWVVSWVCSTMYGKIIHILNYHMGYEVWLFYAIHGIQLWQNVIFKATAVITVYLSRYAIDVRPLIHQNFVTVSALWLYVTKIWRHLERNIC